MYTCKTEHLAEFAKFMYVYGSDATAYCMQPLSPHPPSSAAMPVFTLTLQILQVHLQKVVKS